MTQEEKQLLLNDLCGRLSYGVKVCARFNTGNRYTTNVTAISADRDYIQTRQNVLHSYTGSSVEDIRPYLRPMSSMTEKELNECIEYSGIRELECPQIERFEDRLQWSIKMFGSDFRTIDWLNSNHFDYRELIEKRLALEAPEGMYKTE